MKVFCKCYNNGYVLTEYDIGDSEDVGISEADVARIVKAAESAQALGAVLIDVGGVLWALQGVDSAMLYDYRHLL